ncbi:MAG: hypothetical protein ACRD3A_13205 [Terriglobales bacterium]
MLVRQAIASERAAEASSENARAAKESADAARDSSIVARIALVSAQRAFVNFPYEFSIVKLPREDDSTVGRAWDIRLKVTNDGNTPTVGLRMRANWHWQGGVLPDDYSFSDLGQGGPEHPLRIMPKSHIFTQSLEIPKEIMDKVKRKEYRLYFYGWAEYSDVFDGTPRHRTTFCHEGSVVETSEGHTLVLISFPRHNEAD